MSILNVYFHLPSTLPSTLLPFRFLLKTWITIADLA